MDESSRSNLEELFKLLTEQRISRSGYEYEGNNTWLENAEKEDKRHPFAAILATENPNNNDQILLSDQIDKWPDHLWDLPNSFIVKRDQHAITKLLSPLLQKSREIAFIDPYFRATRFEFRELLIALLQVSISCSAYPTEKKIEIHVSADIDNYPAADQFAEIHRNNPKKGRA